MEVGTTSSLKYMGKNNSGYVFMGKLLEKVIVIAENNLFGVSVLKKEHWYSVTRNRTNAYVVKNLEESDGSN